MKKTSKRILSVILSLMILVSLFITAEVGVSASNLSQYEKGDLITLGSYPQTEVTDKNLLTKLNSLSITWQSYNYYSGDYTDPATDPSHGPTWVSWDTMRPSDYMKYADMSYNGEKYRAVTFTEQRPGDTGGVFLQESDYHIAGKVYWFKYEPLQWRVLDPATGLVLCELVIDSQAFSNTTYKKEPIVDPTEYRYYDDDYGFYSDPEHTVYSNNYAHSSIREWLNDDFYNTAFNSNEKTKIEQTVCDNRSYDSYMIEYMYPDYPLQQLPFDAEETTDSVFLPSFKELYFNESGEILTVSEREVWKAKSTDYAVCQGVLSGIDSSTNPYEIFSYWWIRTASTHSNIGWAVGDDGNLLGSEAVTRTYFGVRPAMRITESDVTPDVECEIEVTDIKLNYKKSKELPVNVNLSNYTITYSSSDESVATVDKDGFVTAVGTGEAEITVTVVDASGNEYKDTCNVTVTYSWWQLIIYIVLFGWLWY